MRKQKKMSAGGFLALTVILTMLLCGCGKTGPWQDKQEEKDTAAETDSEQGKADQTEQEQERETEPETEGQVQEPVQADKIIALTFDDGPSVTTTKVLDILEEYDIVATFFLIGQNIPGNEKILDRQIAMGCELCNHSYSYDSMDQMTPEEIQKSIADTTALIEETAGQTPMFFRPPNIAISNTMYENIDLPFICGFLCNDWVPTETAKQRCASVLKQAKDGGIILLHDFYGNDKTVEALPAIIEGLQADGYEFVTLSELFERKGVDPDVEYKIWTVVE